MPRISLNGASEAATRFFRREAGIVMPVAFATFGLGMLLVTLAAPPPGEDGQLQHGPWMLAMIPALLAALVERYFSDWEVPGEPTPAPDFGEPEAPTAEPGAHPGHGVTPPEPGHCMSAAFSQAIAASMAVARCNHL